jgi:hypothetical protein
MLFEFIKCPLPLQLGLVGRGFSDLFDLRDVVPACDGSDVVSRSSSKRLGTLAAGCLNARANEGRTQQSTNHT